MAIGSGNAVAGPEEMAGRAGGVGASDASELVVVPGPVGGGFAATGCLGVGAGAGTGAGKFEVGAVAPCMTRRAATTFWRCARARSA